MKKFFGIEFGYISENPKLKTQQLKMKNFILVLLALCLNVQFISAQASRTTHYTVAANDISTVNIDLDSDNVEIIETKGSRVIIEARIILETIGNTNLLEFLINSGRYALINTVDQHNQTLTIKRKRVTSEVIVKGERCKEIVKYRILIPNKVRYINTAETTASI